MLVMISNDKFSEISFFSLHLTYFEMIAAILPIGIYSIRWNLSHTYNSYSIMMLIERFIGTVYYFFLQCEQILFTNKCYTISINSIINNGFVCPIENCLHSMCCLFEITHYTGRQLSKSEFK